MDIFKSDGGDSGRGRKSYGAQCRNGYHHGNRKRKERKLHVDRYAEKRADNHSTPAALIIAAADNRAVNGADANRASAHRDNTVSDGANSGRIKIKTPRFRFYDAAGFF